MSTRWSLLLNKKMIIILVLGFASGLPLGLSGSTLQAWFTVENIDLITIGFIGLVGQPYAYKFLWAPVMDSVAPAGGRRRGWILWCQAALIVLLCTMAFLNPSESPWLLGFVALALAFASASQDIAIDAYRTEILTQEQRGVGAAMAVAGYRVAMLVSGGLGLILADSLGFQLTYFVMAGAVCVTALITYTADEPPTYGPRPASTLAAFVEPFREFLSRRNAWMLLLLVVLYKLGDAFAGSLTTTFLLRGVGFSLTAVGFANKSVGLVATLFGVFLGGVLLARIGLFRSLLWFGVIQALSNLAYLLLAQSGDVYWLMAVCVFLENVGGGLGTAAFMALLMSLCHSKYAATQYALLSALAAVGRVYISPLAGVLVEQYGWVDFFVFSLFISIPGLILLLAMRQVITQEKKGELGVGPEPSISK